MNLTNPIQHKLNPQGNITDFDLPVSHQFSVNVLTQLSEHLHSFLYQIISINLCNNTIWTINIPLTREYIHIYESTK